MGSVAAERDALGVYGKIPAQGDFVRINASDDAAQALDLWVQEALETLGRMGVPFPTEPLYFLHHGGHPSLPATIGAMVASHDRVGRVYPMTVFARVDPAWLATRWSGAPLGYGLFLRDATRILRDLSRTDAQLLTAWTRNLRLPSPQDLAQVDVVCMHALQTFSAAQVLPRMTGDPQAATCWYALKTAVDACDSARVQPGSSAHRARRDAHRRPRPLRVAQAAAQQAPGRLRPYGALDRVGARSAARLIGCAVGLGLTLPGKPRRRGGAALHGRCGRTDRRPWRRRGSRSRPRTRRPSPSGTHPWRLYSRPSAGRRSSARTIANPSLTVVMDVEELRSRAQPWTAPISDDAPAGANASTDPQYAELRDEVAKRNSPSGGQIQWRKVIDNATELLQNRSKDLLVASYMAFGLYTSRGLDGLVTGLSVLSVLIEDYWTTAYPEQKRMRGRVNAVEWIIKSCDMVLPNLAVTAKDRKTLNKLTSSRSSSRRWRETSSPTRAPRCGRSPKACSG